MKQLMLLTLISLLALSCELVMDLDVPYKGKQVTANSFFNPDSVFSVQLSLDRYILDQKSFERVDDAEVIIQENGNTIATLDGIGNGIFRAPDVKPEYGKAYALVVKVPGHAELKARSTIPFPATITSVDVYETSNNTKMKVRIKDDGAVANFYEMQIAQVYERYWYTVDKISAELHRFQLTSNDPLIQNDDPDSHKNGIVFTDALFNGKEVELDFDLSGGGLSFHPGMVVLRTLSEDGYNYLRTLDLSDRVSGDPFAQPVNVYNNVGNGFGIFAGFSTSAFPYGPPRPVITSIDPPTARPGDHIVITGENFVPEQHISVFMKLPEEYSSSFQIVSITPTRIEFKLHEHVRTGRIGVSNGWVAMAAQDLIIVE